MGNCNPNNGVNADDMGKKKDKELDDELQVDRKKDRSTKKLLLLGPGNSGKSTFFKQLLQIHGDGFTQKHFMDATKSVYDSILGQMKAVITQAKDLGYKVDEKTEEAVQFFDDLPRDIEIDEDIAANIKIIWNDPAMQKAFDNRKSLNIVDSAPHFFKEIERIGKPDYKPTEEDLLLVRVPTTGVTESHFLINGHSFRIFDVGGQRSERSKWIHCFDTVTAVIFVASLSCYDQSLFEDENVNAMHEALNLFDEVCNSRWFRKTSMILFLNKRDLFQEKIKRRSLKICFETYEGPDEFNDGVAYIRERFVERNTNQRTHQVYSHQTCATERNDVIRVFNDVQHIVVNVSLQKGGLL